MQYLLDARADVRPNLFPNFACARTERPRAFNAERRPVGVVAEKRQVLAPGHPHRVARGEQNANGSLKALRPRRYRAERGLRPIEGAHKRGHFAVSGEKLAI